MAPAAFVHMSHSRGAASWRAHSAKASSRPFGAVAPLSGRAVSPRRTGLQATTNSGLKVGRRAAVVATGGGGGGRLVGEAERPRGGGDGDRLRVGDGSRDGGGSGGSTTVRAPVTPAAARAAVTRRTPGETSRRRETSHRRRAREVTTAAKEGNSCRAKRSCSESHAWGGENENVRTKKAGKREG